jgi:hypothetical protein
MPPPHKKVQPKNTDPSRAIIKLSFKTLRPIEQAMDETEKQNTGIGRLKKEELINLNEWLDSNAVLAPGDQPHNQ